MAISLRLTVKDGSTPASNLPPVEREPLLRDAAPAAPPGNPPALIGRNRKILVVDDNPVVLKAFEIKLKSSGFAVVTTENGAAVARTAELEKPELIILDINFPSGSAMEWSGFTILQWLRRFPELAKIPVIFITGSETQQYQEKARAAGAVALFQKPVDYKVLLPAILQAIGDPLPTPPPAP